MCWVMDQCSGAGGRYSAQQQGVCEDIYGSAHFVVCICVWTKDARSCDLRGWCGAAAVLVVPGLLTVRTPVVATHAVIGTPLAAASASASASVPPSVSLSVTGASSSRRSDSKDTTSMTSSASASEDIDGDEDIDSQHGGLHRLRRREEPDIGVDVEGMEVGDVDEEGRGCYIRPISRVWWEEQRQQEHPVRGVLGRHSV